MRRDQQDLPTKYCAAGAFTTGSGGASSGITAAVVLPEEADILPDILRQALANAAGLPTAFITDLFHPNMAACDVTLRFFAPASDGGREVERCAHAGIATIGLLHERAMLGGARRGLLHTRAGSLAFAIGAAGGELMDDATGVSTTMLGSAAGLGAGSRVYTQTLAPRVSTPLARAGWDLVAAALGDPHSLFLDEGWAPRVASVGVPALLVAVHDGDGLRSLKPDRAALAALLLNLGATQIQCFAPAAGAAGEPLATGSQFRYRVAPSGPSFEVRGFACGQQQEAEEAEGAAGGSAGSVCCALGCALWAAADLPPAPPGVSFAVLGAGTASPPSAEVAVLPPGVDDPAGPSSSVAPAAASNTGVDLARPWVGGLCAPRSRRDAHRDAHRRLHPAFSRGRYSPLGGRSASVPLALVRPFPLEAGPRWEARAEVRGEARRQAPSPRAASSPLAAAAGSEPLPLLSPAGGCPACVGAKRGVFGEVFCRRCGRSYQRARQEWSNDIRRMDGGVVLGAGAHHVAGWCESIVSTVALCVHRIVR